MKANFTHVTKNETNFYKRFCKKFTSFRRSKSSLSKRWIAVSEKCPKNEKYDPENYSEYFYDAVQWILNP